MARRKDWNQTLREASDNFTEKIDEVDASTTYIGKALFGTASDSAKWQIKKISVSGTVTTIAYASGDDDFIHIWDNRASLSYS